MERFPIPKPHEQRMKGAPARSRPWGWRQIAAAWILFLLPFLLPAQCVLNCRYGDPQSPRIMPIDSTGRIALVLDSLIQNPSACPGVKYIVVRNDKKEAIARDTFTSAADTMLVKVGKYLGKMLYITVEDQASGFFCVGYLRTVDRTGPNLVCGPDDTVGCNSNTSPQNLGQPEVIDNSGFPPRDLTFVDEWLPGECSDPVLGLIVRTWTAVDSSGNTGTCEQRIFIRKHQPQEISFPPDTVLNCESANIDPLRLGLPTLNGIPLSNEGFCGLTFGYRDDTIPQKSGAEIVIVRRWEVIDDCNRFTLLQDQTITIRDVQAPQIVCPADVVVRTLPNRCYANVRLPRPVITDNCDPMPLLTVSTSYGATGLGEHQFVGVGTHSVVYTVRDASGNSSRCTIQLRVIDEETPTAICDEITVASIPSSGYARVSATSFDKGSYDNCKPKVFFKVRRMTILACDAANGDDSPAPGVQEWFDDHVIFCCEEAGGEGVQVILRVYDTDPGPGPVNPSREAPGGDLHLRYNECMVRVQIQDKQGPQMECPRPLTVSCTEDLFDTGNFGSPIITDRCGYTLDSTEVRSLNNCGVGTITRTWRATDRVGNVSTCTQVITVVNPRRLDLTNIRWPANYTIEQCGASLLPDDLPSGFNKPTVINDACLLVGVNYKDQLFNVSFPGCFEIMREWTLIDLCNYDPLRPELGGRYSFIQRIRVNDRQPPQLRVPRDTTVSLIKDCRTARVNLAPAIGTDACSNQVTIRNDSPFADAAGANASGTYPLGTTEVVFTATDNCGNVVREKVRITVVDKVAPAPVCIVGLSANLTTMTGGPGVSVKAEAFDAGTIEPCGTPIRRTIRLKTNGSLPAPNTTELMFTCEDIGLKQIEFWVTDAVGNSDFCETFILIQDNNGLCPSTPGNGGNGRIAGTIKREDGSEVEEVMVKVSSASPLESMTGSNGFFQIPNLPMGKDYTIVPEKNKDLMNGVSTIDLVIMSKHILGINKLNSPYKIIAADVDRSGSVSTLDMIRLRKLILGLQEELPNSNTSWRFVRADYKFPDASNPFLEKFPEFYNVNNFKDKEMKADFVAIKVGDLNQSARANNLGNLENRALSGTLKLKLDDRHMRQGETATFDVYASDLDSIMGFQFTLAFDTDALAFDELELGDLPGLTEENFGLNGVLDGWMTMSWNELASAAPGEDVLLFRLTFRAIRDGLLSKSLQINSQITQAEAYNREAGLLDVALDFKAADLPAPEEGLILGQNRPNPFRAQTFIPFEIRAAARVKLRIFDVSGKMVYQREKQFEAGPGEWEVYAADLPGSGILYYTVEAGGATATRKMILMK